MTPADNSWSIPGRRARRARVAVLVMSLLPLSVGAAQRDQRTAAPTDTATPFDPYVYHSSKDTTHQPAKTITSRPSPDALRLPVLFSFSGGISLGAYQAGVSWAMIEFVKATHRQSYRTLWNVPRLDVSAMSGASAGNINVLLGSVQYCDTTQRAEDQSLLWQMWVNTGWNELAPARILRDPRENDHGILDRGSIRKRVQRAIQSSMDSSTFEQGCSVPLGVATTRLSAGVISHDDNVSVRNQRFVSLFRMREANGKLQLVRPDSALLGDPGLGQQLVVPADIAVRTNPPLPSDTPVVITLSRVFTVVMASAAYPVAFAPVLIEYQEPSCVLNSHNPPGCTARHKEMFLDGGVFDNNPVGLALRMQAKVDTTDKRPRIIYVDPNALRGKLRQHEAERDPASSELRDRGVAALFHFAGGFIRTVRQYELQTFIRQNLAAPDTSRAFILSSTRAHPVMGEYFGAFGAFFGRPFREFDFYAGVADGLRFVAREIICDPSGLQRYVATHAQTAAGRPVANDGDGDGVAAATKLSGDDRDACTRKHLAELASDPFELSAVGRKVVRDVLLREDSTYKETVHEVGLDAAHVDRYAAINAVEQATAAQMDDDRPFVCESGDLPKQLLCWDGFDRVLDSLSHDTLFVRLVERWSHSDACRESAADADAVCRAEPILHDFVRDRHAAMQGLLDQLFARLRASEEELANEHAPNQKLLVKTIEFLYRSTDQQARRGWDLDPSSIPPHDAWYWGTLHLLPFYVGGTVGNAGTQFGWQPTRHLGRWHLAAATPLEFSRLPQNYARAGAYSWYGSLSPSIGRDFGVAWLNGILVGVRGEFNLGARHAVPWFRRRSAFMPEVSVLAVANKLRFSLYRVPPDMAFNQKPLLRGTVSFADVNGVLYWLLR